MCYETLLVDNSEWRKTMNEEIMTIEECAKYLKTSVSTIYRLAQQGKIPATKVGNQWRFQKKKIDEWLEKGGNLKKGSKIKG